MLRNIAYQSRPECAPRSPAIASRANMAVPPLGSRPEHMLMVPGHIMPTENPHTIQPIRVFL